jgi:Mrp family chromosome partitioning ATPase
MAASLLDMRLLLVTGKGGVGKTTVCASLGLQAAKRGKRVLLVEGPWSTSPVSWEFRTAAASLIAELGAQPRPIAWRRPRDGIPVRAVVRRHGTRSSGAS